MREQAEALKSQASRMSDEEVQAVWDKVNQQVREEQAKVAAAIKNPPPTTPAEPNGLRFGMSEDDVFKAEAEAFAALTKNKPKPISEAEAAKEQAMRERAEMELAQRFLEAAAADAGMTMEEIYNKVREGPGGERAEWCVCTHWRGWDGRGEGQNPR